MARRAIGIASILVVLAGMIPVTVTLAGAHEQRSSSVHRVARAKPPATSFSPGLPSRLDEFSGDANLRSVHFDVDRAVIRAADARILDADAQWLKRNPNQDILIEAFADERGSRDHNMALATRRARAVKNALVARGVRADRIVIAGYGEARPACVDRTEACWMQNRRVDILVRNLPPQVPSS
jgi:peptidoglycan-associated lipoprotein